MSQSRKIAGTTLGTFLGALLIAALVSCASQPEAPGAGTATPDDPIAVRTVAAQLGAISARSSYVARVEARDRVDLVPLAAGRIEKLPVEVGAPVSRDQVLVELSHTDLDHQLEDARAALLGAEAELAATKAAVAPDRSRAESQLTAALARLEQLMSPAATDIQAARSAVDIAESQLTSARTRLALLRQPTSNQVAAARLAVSEAETAVSAAQTAVNQAIRERLSAGETTLSSQVRSWWQSLLEARLRIQANQAVIQNLQTAFGLDLSEQYLRNARQKMEEDQDAIGQLMAQIQAASVVPQPITNALWSETSARRGLESAREDLAALQDPDARSIALAQDEVDEAQAAVDSRRAALERLQHPTEAALAEARAQVAQAEQAVTLSGEAYTGLAVAAAQSRVRQAEAQVSRVEQQLSDTRITAPFDGWVARRWLSPGALATTQTPVVSISSSQVVVSVAVEDTAIDRFQEGTVLILTSPALPGRAIPLRTRYISPSGDQPEHTFLVQLEPQEPVAALRPGMSGELSLEISNERAVLVPRTALVFRGNQAHVFVAEQGRARLRTIDTGPSDDRNVQVVAGLAAGERVITDQLALLTDGAPIVEATE